MARGLKLGRWYRQGAAQGELPRGNQTISSWKTWIYCPWTAEGFHTLGTGTYWKSGHVRRAPSDARQKL